MIGTHLGDEALTRLRLHGPAALRKAQGEGKSLLSGYIDKPRWSNRCLTRARFNLSLRGVPAHPEFVEGRGNLDEAGHTSTNRGCYGDGIATLRSQ